MSDAAHHQMKAVSDLNRIWRSLPRTFSKRAGTVARDDLHTRMRLKPGGEGGGTGIGKQLEWAIRAEIDQDRFEIQAFAVGPFVYAKKRGRCPFSLARPTNQAQ